MNKYIITAAVFTLINVHTAGAQDAGYVYTPKQKTAADETSWKSPNCSQPKELDQLLGEKVVFIAKNKRSQANGYMTYRWLDKSFMGVPYDALVGKVGTIVEIQSRPAGNSNFRRVTIKLDSSGASVVANALDDAIPEVTLLADIEEGRNRWTGKTLWNASHILFESTDSEYEEMKVVTKFQPVNILGVMVGANTPGEINFVVQFKNGQEGLVSLNLSVSNTSPSFIEAMKRLGRKECNFDNKFLTEDPHLTHKWSKEVWSALENNQVIVGMTLEQVIFGWGKPKSINTTQTEKLGSSQLVYSNDRYVYVDSSGIVTAVQK